MMELKTCANCKDKFVFSHVNYRPRVRYEALGGELFTTVYCSDACEEGIPKGTKAACRCDLRNLGLSEGRVGGEKWVCLLHAMVFEKVAT